MKKRITDEGFKRIAQGMDTQPTMAINPADIPGVTETAVDPSLEAPQNPAAAESTGDPFLELFNFVKESFPADYILEELVRLLPPEVVQRALEDFSDDHNIAPPKQLDPEDFDFGY
ncbi:hypothetical protein N8Z24_00075 [bacterium]|nr:hypothetical protein [bacterium]